MAKTPTAPTTKATELTTTSDAGTGTDIALSERPAFLKVGDVQGTEGITQDDLQIPRIAIAQGTSDQIKEESPQYIDGLKLYHMFNTVTKQIYGRGPIHFAIVRRDPPRYIEFKPRSEGGGIVDMNVPANDPRTQFTRDPETGASVKPVATKFYDFLVVTLPLSANPMESIVALSMKNTQLKVAKQLNSLIKLRNAPLYAGVYSLSTISEKNSEGEYGNFVVKNHGWASEATFKALKTLYEALADKNIVIDREPGSDDDDFPTDGGTASDM